MNPGTYLKPNFDGTEVFYGDGQSDYVRAYFGEADATATGFPDQCADVVIGSPPYLEARTYGIKAQRAYDEWVAFMMAATTEALRVSKGLVLWIVSGTTKKGNYTPGPEGLMAAAFKAGIHQYRPLCWYKVDADTNGGCGQPGSGGKQWLRADWEYVIAFKRPGPLPFADPLFEHRPLKFEPGGKIRTRGKNGGRSPRAFKQPKWANPGNVIKARVGSHIGDKEAFQSEAPFPEKLVAPLIQAFCPVGGWVYDPFSGSGTTAVEAVRLGRNAVGTDLRASQIPLATGRLVRRIKEGRSGPILCPFPRRVAA